MALYGSLLVGHYVHLVSLLPPFVRGLVSVLVGPCVRLVSLLFLVASFFVGHGVRLVSLLFLFVSVRFVSLCFFLSLFLSPFLFVIVSILSPFLLMSQKVDLGMVRCCLTCLGSTAV